MYSKIVLSIDSELNLLEKYFNKYVTLPDESYLRFIPYKRFFLDKKDKTLTVNTDVIRNTPYLPYKCLDCVNDYIIYSIYYNSGYMDLFLKNELLETSKRFLPEYTDEEDYVKEIITTYIPNHDLDMKDYREIKGLLNHIYRKVSMYTDMYPKNIWELDYETNLILLINKGEIGSFRFEEVLEQQKIKEEHESN